MIDVGANMGDSLAMMVSENASPMVVVEGSDHYFEYLQQNVQRLPKDRQANIRLINTLVGTGAFGGDLDHTGGTASLFEGSKGVSTHQRLDALVTDPISLIKVDTDGFYYDV